MLKEGLNQRVFQRARIKGPSNDMKLPDTCFPPTKVKKKKKITAARGICFKGNKNQAPVSTVLVTSPPVSPNPH